MKKPIFIFALIVFLTASACGLPLKTRWSPTPVSVAQVGGPAPVQNPGPAATPTTEALGNVPEQPTPDPIVNEMPDGVVNIMVLGSDFRPDSGFRTDVMMLVSVNTAKGTVSAISFPRDLYVTIPGWTTQRLNTAFPHGGFDLLANTMEQDFGVRPTYYVMTDFQGFQGIIDSLGGIDIYAGSRINDTCDLPTAENGRCTIEPGPQHMDGQTALWYVRSRHSSSDLDRNRRQQEVMMGIFSRMMTGGGVENMPALFAQYQNSVKTNLTIQAITPLLPTAAQVFADHNRIHRYSFTTKEAKPYITDTGAQVLLPDYDLINQILNEAIFNQ